MAKHIGPAKLLAGLLALSLMISLAVPALAADTAARTVISPVVLPVGAVTSLLGAPLFFYMLLKGKRVK